MPLSPPEGAAAAAATTAAVQWPLHEHPTVHEHPMAATTEMAATEMAAATETTAAPLSDSLRPCDGEPHSEWCSAGSTNSSLTGASSPSAKLQWFGEALRCRQVSARCEHICPAKYVS
eukprot:9498276-Pyramimonas_sp.AAC.3